MPGAAFTGVQVYPAGSMRLLFRRLTVALVRGRLVRAVAVAAVLATAPPFPLFAQPAEAEGLPRIVFPTDEVVIRSQSGEHRFVVEVARSPDQRSRGLMFRRSMPPDAGMLFDFLEEVPVSMWMKNTIIPLDMLFFDSTGRIVRIEERTVPLSLTVISSGVPVRGVLEVNAGTVARLGIRPGDRVIYKAFEQKG